MRFLPALLLPLVLAACGSAPTTPSLDAQANRRAEAREVEIYGRACAVRVLARLIELAADDFRFVTPGATCTNDFLGQDALYVSSTIRSTAIVARPEPVAVDVFLVSKTGRRYTSTITVDGAVSFSGP